ncbi:MAG: hypothetical protein AB7O98_09430 [Hyphomonadaceae bacterium]
MAFDANDLSPHEHFVVERTRAGETADFTALAGAGGAKPVVRAGFIRKLMMGLDPSWGVQLPGVRIKAARIEGALDLADCSGAGGAGLPALSLEHCDIPDAIDVSHARLARLSIAHSRFRRLIGVEAEIDGEFTFFKATPLAEETGEETAYIRMRSVRIGGDVIGRGAKLARAVEPPADIAYPTDAVLYLQRARIEGNCLLGDGFDCFGSVWLLNAQIGGGLELEGSQILNRSDDGDGCALVLSSARVGGDLYLRNGFKAEGMLHLRALALGGGIDANGAVIRNGGGIGMALDNVEISGDVAGPLKMTGRISMQGAKIARNLDLRGSEIADPITPRGDAFGRVIDATSASIGAALLQGANIKGEIYLPDARIAGYLAFGGGRFINGGNWAIRAPNVRVGGNVTFKISDDGYAPHGQKTVVEGGAKFDRAQIDGTFAWTNLELRGPGPDDNKGAVLSFADARINGSVQARGLVTQQDARIDASGASCAALDDDVKAGWGVDGAALDLEGFTYNRLEGGERWRERLSWLRRARGERFSPQPFSQLATVYARAGRREDARRIQLAQQDQRTAQASPGPVTWALSSLFGLIAGYGLAPIRVTRALVLFLALGVLGVLAMNAQGALVTPAGQACNGTIEPALYAVDVALPIIDLGQASKCGPGRTARADLSPGIAVGESDWRLFEGAAVWKWAHALYAILGAILAALAVITFSGVLKPKDD